MNAGFFGESQARVQAPVDAPLNGSLHGAHRFPVAQGPCVSSLACAWTWGRQSEVQRPSEAGSGKGEQVGGT